MGKASLSSLIFNLSRSLCSNAAYFEAHIMIRKPRLCLCVCVYKYVYMFVCVFLCDYVCVCVCVCV